MLLSDATLKIGSADATKVYVGSTLVWEAATTPPDTTGDILPYDASSPWNTPILSAPVIHDNSDAYITAISDNVKPLTSDVDQYTIGVYLIDDTTPLRSIQLAGNYGTYDAGDNSRVGFGTAPLVTNVPIPDDAVAPTGSDGQIILWDPVNGVEYGFWQFGGNATDGYTATNGYRYHTTTGYLGRFADGKAGRGAGTPYLSGLVRPWEIAQGHIDHALSFAYQYASPSFVYPASKSDGIGVAGTDVPEGSRIQLDPSKTEADFDAVGLSETSKILARALQAFGMYVIDNAGSSKVYIEYRGTAGWGAEVTADMLSAIPWSWFRVLAQWDGGSPPAPPTGVAPVGSVATSSSGGGAASFALTVPADIPDGAEMHLVVNTQTAGVTVPAPTGWTVETIQTGALGVVDTILTKVKAGDTSVTVTFSGGSAQYGAVLFGVQNSGGIGAIAGAADNTSDSQLDVPAVTTTVDSSLVIAVAGGNANSMNFTVPTGYTLIGTAPGKRVSVAYIAAPTVGTVAATSFASDVATTRGEGVQYEIKPA